MTDEHPKGPFNDKANPKLIRDKDNAKPRVKPPSMAQTPAPNLAPFGAKGIRRGLPSNQPYKQKRFIYKRKGDMAREFKSIMRSPPDKTNGLEH